MAGIGPGAQEAERRDCPCPGDTGVSGGGRQKKIRIHPSMTIAVTEIHPQGIGGVQRMPSAP